MGMRVTLEPLAGSARILRFQIQGLLKVDPAPERVSFDTMLELTKGEYEVKGD
jgi:type VI secretion system protein ImpF